MTPAGWGARETGCCTLAACHHSVCLRRRGAVRPPERRSKDISLLGRGWGGVSARARCGGTNSRRSTVPAGFSLPAVPTTRQTSPPAEKSRDRAHRGGWGAHSSTNIVGGGRERAPANCNPPSAPTPSRPCALVGCGCEKEKKKVEPSHGTRHGSHTSRGAESPQLPPVHRVSALPTRDILSRAPLCRLVAPCPSLGTPEAKTCSDRRNTFSAQPPLQAPLGPGFPS